MKSDDSKMPKILVVEDDKEILEAYEFWLNINGYQSILARDGRRGLEKVASDCPDLIITDDKMRLMSGYEMAKQLKSQESTKHIPIIMVGANVPKEAYNIYDYCMEKPGDMGKLAEKIKELLNL